MENNNQTVDLIQAIEIISYKIKQKCEYLVFKDPTNIDQTLLDLVNTVALIRNLSKDIFSFMFLSTQEQRKQMFECFPYLSDYAPQLETKPVNLVWYNKTLDVIYQTLEDIDQADPNNRHLIVFLEQKLKLFMIIYPFAISFDHQDIMNLEKSNVRWDEVNKLVTFKVLGPPDKVLKSINEFRKGIKIATAILQKASNSKSKLFSYMVGSVFYFFDEGEKNKKNIEFRSNMEIKKVRTMVNFFEDGLSKFMFRVTFPFISFHTKIFINYCYPSLSPESIDEWIENKMEQPVKFGEPQFKQIQNDTLLFTENLERISVRVLCNEDLKISAKRQKHSKIIIHVHGGGFIGLSSRSHQVYTRRWAKEAKIPVFSIDYRKAPETPYPGPLDDCWQVYNWIVNQSHKYFNIEEKKEIIFAGDSAGGNLILGLNNLIIQHNLQKPICLLLFYPALNLLMQTFTPSLMHSLQDPLLSFQFLFLCLRSYVQGEKYKPGIDYLISPIFTPDNILKQYPTVRLFAGELDPLYDESIRFVQKLGKNAVDVKMISYENMMHGYLNLDVPGGVKYSAECVNDSIAAVKQFVKNI